MRMLVFLLFYLALSQLTAAQEQNKGWGWLGVELRDVTQKEADKLGWDAPAGAKILSVDAKGPPRTRVLLAAAMTTSERRPPTHD